MMKFDELPVKIQERMLEEQVNQGNERNPDVFREDIAVTKHEGGFNWWDTHEGAKAWIWALDDAHFGFLYEANPSLKPD